MYIKTQTIEPVSHSVALCFQQVNVSMKHKQREIWL